MSDNYVAAYREARLRLQDLARGLTAAQAATPVPTCPGWTVQDVLAHQAGDAADLVAGNTDGVATDPWTARHVDQRRSRTVDTIIQELNEQGTLVEGKLPAIPSRFARMLVSDIVLHEQDIRGALRQPGALDSVGFRLTLNSLIDALRRRIERGGLPALHLEADGEEWLLGEGDPAATVSAPAFELMRALAGRRSIAQIAAHRWQGDREAYLPIFAYFPPPDLDIIE